MAMAYHGQSEVFWALLERREDESPKRGWQKADRIAAGRTTGLSSLEGYLQPSHLIGTTHILARSGRRDASRVMIHR